MASQKILHEGIKDTQHPLALFMALDMLSPAHGSPRIIGRITCRPQTNIKRQRELKLSHKNSSCLSVRAFILQKKIQTRQTRLFAMLVLVPNVLEVPLFKINDDVTCVVSHSKLCSKSPFFHHYLCLVREQRSQTDSYTSHSEFKAKIFFVPFYSTSIDFCVAQEYSYVLQLIVALYTCAFFVLRDCPWKLKETSTGTLKTVWAASTAAAVHHLPFTSTFRL